MTNIIPFPQKNERPDSACGDSCNCIECRVDSTLIQALDDKFMGVAVIGINQDGSLKLTSTGPAMETVILLEIAKRILADEITSNDG